MDSIQAPGDTPGAWLSERTSVESLISMSKKHNKNDMAEDRTVLANERTFAGWMRTSMACVAVALGVPVLARDLNPGWWLNLASSLLILAAILLVWMAWRRTKNVLSQLDVHTISTMSQSLVGMISIALVAVYVVLGILLWTAL